MPAWLIAKRLAPPPKAQPGPIKATLEVPFSKTYLPSGGVRLVSLELTQYPRPPTAHARMLLEVQTRPPPESYLTQAYDTEAVKKAVDLFGHLPWPPPPPPKEGQNAKPAPKSSKGRGGGGGGGGGRRVVGLLQCQSASSSCASFSTASWGPRASTAPFDLPSRIVWVKVHLHAVAGGVRVGGGAAVDVTDGSEEVLEPAPADDGGAVGVACGVIVAPLSEWTAAAVL